MEMKQAGGQGLHDAGFNNDFLKVTSQARAKQTKKKTNGNCLQLQRCYCTAKELINRVTNQPTEWEKLLLKSIYYP